MKRIGGARIWAHWHPFPYGYTLWEYKGSTFIGGVESHRFTPYGMKAGVDRYLSLDSLIQTRTSTFRPFILDTESLDAA